MVKVSAKIEPCTTLHYSALSGATYCYCTTLHLCTGRECNNPFRCCTPHRDAVKSIFALTTAQIGARLHASYLCTNRRTRDNELRKSNPPRKGNAAMKPTTICARRAAVTARLELALDAE